jgi:hypothetical protein
MDKFKWHKWFAWHPVPIFYDFYNTTITIWLETIYRRKIFDDPEGFDFRWHWEYKVYKPIEGHRND